MGVSLPGGAQALRIGLTTVSTVGVASVSTAAVGVRTSVVRLVSSTDCFVLQGATGTVTVNTGAPMAADIPEYFRVQDGDKFHHIQSAGGGTFYMTEMS